MVCKSVILFPSCNNSCDRYVFLRFFLEHPVGLVRTIFYFFLNFHTYYSKKFDFLPLETRALFSALYVDNKLQILQQENQHFPRKSSKETFLIRTFITLGETHRQAQVAKTEILTRQQPDLGGRIIQQNYCM